MTGRDLIIYILANGLEDKPLFTDGKLLGFLTEREAAVKFGVGVATVRVWASTHALDSIQIGNEYYIPANAESPMHKTVQLALDI